MSLVIFIFIWYLIGVAGSIGLGAYTYYTGDDIRTKDMIGCAIACILGPFWTLLILCFILSESNFWSKVVIKGKVQ